MSEASVKHASDATPKKGRLFHLRQAFAMSGTMLTALLALVSGGLALFFQIRPDLLPDPRTHLGAAATVFAVDRNVSLGSYLERRQALVSPAEYTKERNAYISQAQSHSAGDDGSSVLTLPGEDVFVNTRVEGFKSRSIAMLASMYDAKTRRRVPELSNVRVFQQQLESPSDQSVVEFWFFAPPVTIDRYFVRVALYHRGDGVLLAVADSKPIRAGR
jgi:hypothetical protein